MDRREVYPEHHLAILLGLIRRGRASTGPSIAEQARLAVLSRACREEDEIRAAWRALDPEARGRFRGLILASHPQYLCEFDNYVESMARGLWSDTVRGVGPSPMPEVRAEAPEVAPECPAPADEPDPELTPAQMAFIASLTPGQRRRLDAVSAARRREVLAPFADDFDPRLFEVMAAELRPAAEPSLEPATTG